MTKPREPSCILNHEVQRRELKEKGISNRKCSSCGWLLFVPLEKEDSVIDVFRLDVKAEAIKELARSIRAGAIRAGAMSDRNGPLMPWLEHHLNNFWRRAAGEEQEP